MKKDIIIFDKTVERDSTLVMQGIWARVLTGNIEKKFGIINLYRPAIIHYATEENLQVWENRKAVEQLQNELLKKNLKGVDFINLVFNEYKEFIIELNRFWNRGYIIKKEELREYLELIEKSVLGCSIFFYAGNDERTPDKIKKITIKGREIADLFSRSDEFIRNCIGHINKDLKGLENLVMPDEFLDLPSRNELLMRIKGTILIDGTKAVFGVLKEFSEKHENEYRFEMFNAGENAKELKGQAAYLGRARGIVRIVKNRKQLGNVKRGDILVSPMTTPDFISAMKRAAAFITDEGGIVCHAAIVAREMKKPCIVGTKIATQVLKDGDLVEVDAEKGVVKIIKKGNEKN
jgi:phosphohistidine swiveling domain-containing protein